VAGFLLRRSAVIIHLQCGKLGWVDRQELHAWRCVRDCWQHVIACCDGQIRTLSATNTNQRWFAGSLGAVCCRRRWQQLLLLLQQQRLCAGVPGVHLWPAHTIPFMKSARMFPRRSTIPSSKLLVQFCCRVAGGLPLAAPGSASLRLLLQAAPM
jgi:hypothetical protein